MLYSKRIVAQVLNATDGAQVFSKFGLCEPWSKSENNVNHRGICPKCSQPLFDFNPIKNIGKCFNKSCGFGGGLINIVIAALGCTEDEALEHLAKEANMKLPGRPKERRQLFGFFKDSIPYYRGLRDVAKSLAGAVVMGQLEYWFERYPDGFYKFLEPAPNHPLYKPGQSWTEELNISPEEFRTAFDKTGKRYPSKKNFERTPPDDRYFKSADEEYLYCSYFNKKEGMTWYFRNNKVDSIIEELLKKPSQNKTKKDKAMAVSKVETRHGAFLFKDENGRFIKSTNGNLSKTAMPISRKRPKFE